MPFIKRPVNTATTTNNNSSVPVERPHVSPSLRTRARPGIAGSDRPPAAPENSDPVTATLGGKPPEQERRKPYDVGYGKPPVEHRFKTGNPGGPGRPHGSQSQDTLLRKHLSKRRRVTIEGKRVNVPIRELAIMVRLKEAVEEKKRHSLDYMLNHAHRLFAAPPVEQQAGDAVPEQFDAIDEAVLAELKAMLLAEQGEQS